MSSMEDLGADGWSSSSSCGSLESRQRTDVLQLLSDGESIAVIEAPLDASEESHRCLYVSAETISDTKLDFGSSEINISDSKILPAPQTNRQTRTSSKDALKNACSNPAAVTRSLKDCLAEFSGRRCHLCRRKKSFDLPQSLLLHAQKFHLQKSVQAGDYILLRCHLFCGHRNAHYHCPLCAYTSCGMIDIRRHVLAHGTPRNSAVLSSQNPKLGVRNSLMSMNQTSEKQALERRNDETSCGLLNFERSSAESFENDRTFRSSPTQPSSCASENVHEFFSDRITLSERVLKECNYKSLLETHLIGDGLIKEIKEEPPPLSTENNVNAPELMAPVDCIAVKVEEEEVGESVSDVCLNISASEQTPRTSRLSFPTSIQKAFDDLTLDTCYLCAQNVKFESKTLLEVHFFRHHVRHSIAFTEHSIGLVCNLRCCGLGLHAHCPRCSYLAEDLLEVKSHYSKYHDSDEKKAVTNEKLYLNRKNRLLAGITGLESPSLLVELLMLEVDVVPSVISEFLCDKARESIVLDAAALHDKIKSPHCLLCNDGREYSNPRLLFIHFQRCHVKRANVSCVLPSLMCRLSCKGFGRGHYHCPLCSFVIHDLTKLKVHQQKIHGDALQRALAELAAGRTISPEVLSGHQPLGAAETSNNVVAKLCRGGFLRRGHDGESDENDGENSSSSLPVSVVKDIEAAKSRLSLPDCYLCRSHRDFFTKKRLLDHFERLHLKRAIDYPPYSILSCHLYNVKYRDRGHFHCPWCGYSSHDRHNVHAHLENHASKMELEKPNATKSCARKNDLASRRSLGNNPDVELPPPALISLHPKKPEVTSWRQRFHLYLKRSVLTRPSLHQLVMRRRSRVAIVRHLVHGTPLANSHAGLSNFKVLDILKRDGLKKCLMERVPQRASFSSVGPRLLRCADGLPDPTSHCSVPTTSARERDTCTRESDICARESNTCTRGLTTTRKLRYRRVACVEEFFSILHRLHVTSSNAHVPLRRMMRQLRQKFSRIPCSIVKEFVRLCPECGLGSRRLNVGYRKRLKNGRLPIHDNQTMSQVSGQVDPASVPPPIRRVTIEMFDSPLRLNKGQLVVDDSCSKDDRVETKQLLPCSTSGPPLLQNIGSQSAAQSISSSTVPHTRQFMERMLVNVIDMRDYPDCDHQYILHCQDVHTQLHFLLALRQIGIREIAIAIISKVVSVTGLPSLIVSSSGAEFVECLVTQIALLWTGSCLSLLANCRALRGSSSAREGVSDSSDVVRQLTVRIQEVVSAGRPVLWTSWLPHMQYTLNTQTKLPQLTPFQVVFRRSVCPPVPKAEASTLFNSGFISSAVISNQDSPSNSAEKRQPNETDSKNANFIEILDVTAGGFLVDDGVLSHVEVVLPKSSNSNTPDPEGDFSMSSADLLAEAGENAACMMNSFTPFSVGTTEGVFAIPNNLPAHGGNLAAVKDDEDVFNDEDTIAVQQATANGNAVAVRRDAMNVDDFMAVDNIITVESVTDGLSDSTSIFSSAQNARVEIFPTLEAVVEDADNYFC